MHCVAHFAEETCAERPANGDLETPSQDLEKGKTKTPFYEQTFLWRTEKSSFCFTLFQNSRFCPKKFTFLTYIFIHESNYDFLVRKTTEKYLLGWLTFYRLGWVELSKSNLWFVTEIWLKTKAEKSTNCRFWPTFFYYFMSLGVSAFYLSPFYSMKNL